jgi:hypothetical protein
MSRVGTVACVLFIMFTALAATSTGPATGQEVATSLAIGAVKNALEESLTSFNNTLQTGGGEVKGAGNSLQANAQNVIADIDRVFGKNLNLTFDRMNAQQRALYRDAQRLTQQVNQAALDVLGKTAEEARRTIAEADITAYNASYSLPCRSQIARVVYVTPARIRLGRDVAEFSLRGNFLDGPQNVRVTVDGAPTTVIARSVSEIRIAVPAAVAAKIDSERAIRVEVPLVDTRRTNLWLFCPTSQSSRLSTASVTVAPRRFVSMTGWIQASQLVEERVPRSAEFDSGAPNDCDINVDVSQQICAPEGYSIADTGQLSIQSAAGGSRAGPPTASGDRCIHVPGRHVGSGYNRYPFGVKDCRGRGWIHWTLAYAIKRDVRQSVARFEFTEAAKDQASWNVVYPDYDKLRSPEWKYAVRAVVQVGSVTRTYDISDAQELSGPISARLNNGTLTVSFDEKVS